MYHTSAKDIWNTHFCVFPKNGTGKLKTISTFRVNHWLLNVQVKNEGKIVKLDALRALTRASYSSTKLYYTSSSARIEHNKHK